MDGAFKEPGVPSSKSNLLENLKTGLEGIFLGLAIFLLILLTLNYFNILSLSLIFPKQLGWLPHKPTQKPKVSQQSILSTPTPKLALFCPVAKESCSQAREMAQGDF